jgi:formate dehydrogenase subunit gamma
MSFRLKDSDVTVNIRWIPKYTGIERTLHWVHTLCFLPLALTGYVMFAPWLQPVAQGEAGQAIRLLHRITAVCFGLVPIIYIFFQPRRAWMNLKEFLTWGKDDWLWLKAAIPYYGAGKHEDMPPQPRFNSGERLNAVVMVLGTFLFGVTGLSMWFLKGTMPSGLYTVMVFVHDLTFIVTFVMFIVHFYLAVVHPLMWQSLISMRFGYVSESYAREHHGKWYYGEERAKEMWEQHKAQAAGE